MKKIFSLFIVLLIGLTVFSQVPKIASKVKTLSAISPGTIVQINPNYTDTVADTIFYKIVVNHDAFVTPYISLLHKKAGTRDTTATLTYWQSVNGVDNWQQIQKGKALSAYSLALDTTSINNATIANKGHQISFLKDTGYFESQTLGLRIISNAPTSGSKKAYYKPIYSGSLRVNKY
jgi:hypothetical protein